VGGAAVSCFLQLLNKTEEAAIKRIRPDMIKRYLRKILLLNRYMKQSTNL
jgi:hypothetical protein